MKKLFILFLCGLLCAGTIFAQSGTPFDWELREDVLYIHGEGAMPDFVTMTEYEFAYTSDAPWFEWRNTFTKVEIDEGITHIGNNSFFQCSNLASVSIPSTVTSIGDDAFSDCINLFSAVIPTSVTSIGERAFFSCTDLYSVVIPNSVTSIGDYAFSDCYGLNSVTISASVASIGRHTFINCDNLSNIINIGTSPQNNDPGSFAFSFTILPTCTLRVPSGSVDAYKHAPGWELFDNIEPLEVGLTLDEEAISLTFGATAVISVTVAGDITDPAVVFWISDNPAVATVDNTGTVTAISAGQALIYAAIGDIFEICTVSVNNHSGTAGPLTWEFIDGTLYISGEGDMPDYTRSSSSLSPWTEHVSLITRVEIGEGVTRIGNHAFASHNKLSSVSIPGTVASIGTTVFEYCGNLTSITIPSTVLSIGSPTFVGAGLISISVDAANPNYSSVDGVLFNKDITTLVAYPSGKTGDYVIPSTVEIIGEYSFSQSSNPSSVTIPASVTSIEHNAFWRNFGITSIFIPASVTAIGNAALTQCRELISISADENNPEYTSEDGVLFNKDMTTLLVFPNGRPGHYDIPESVETIGIQAFDGCVLSSVTIPQSVTNIDNGALAGLIHMTSITIPSSVTRIGFTALAGCTGLTSITVPASVTSIGEYAFAKCNGLTEVINPATTPQVIPANVFDEINLNACILRVPAASVNLYRNEAGWGAFKNIVALDAGLALDEEEIFLLRSSTMLMTVNGGQPGNLYNVAWISDNPAVADVDHTGMITAVSLGTTVITASNGISVATCTVTVIEKGTSSIEGTVNNEKNDDVTVNLYVKLPEEGETTSQTKGKVVGGYVLLATTVPNSNSGQYIFDDLPEGSYQVQLVINNYEPEATAEMTLLENTALTDINFFVDHESGTIIVDIPTGTKELSADSHVKVYPNPFAGVLHIEGEEGSTLRIFAIDGKPVYVQTVTGADETIHLERLPAGMYIMRLENGGRTKTVKIIKIP